MLFLQLPLFLVFLPGGDNEDAKDYVQENVCVCMCVHLFVGGGFPKLEIESIILDPFQYPWLQVSGLFWKLCVTHGALGQANVCWDIYASFLPDSKFPLFLSPFSLLSNASSNSSCSFPIGFQEPISFQIIWISSFYNRSWEEEVCSAWLGELQTHRREGKSDIVIYRQPWSKGNFSREDLMESEHILRMFFVRFVQAFFNHASQWKLECKFSSLNREWGYGGSCVCVCVN